ncbi:EpsG family protein [Planococcus sp. X10-3]|uniref:EpsG family protein n=1 Tax=Planococcus sp. X10-3 TaxID=3061240 RepID=UPI003BB1415D
MFYFVLITGLLLSVVNDKKRVSLLIFTSIISLLAFLRYGIGADYFSYELLYFYIEESPFEEFFAESAHGEIGFRLFGSVLKGFGVPYQLYLVIIATINMIYVWKLVKKYSLNPTLSLVIYFSFFYFVWTFSGLRQGLTLVIGIYYLLEAIEKNKTLKIILVSLTLSLIHSSALILIFLYFITKINFSKNQLMLLAISGFLMSFLPLNLILPYLTWIPIIENASQYVFDVGGLNSLDFAGIVRVLLLIFIFLYYESFSSTSLMNKKILDIYIISLILYFIMQSLGELTAARFSIYGKYLEIIILVNIFYLHKKRINKLIYSYGLIVLCSLYLYKETNTLELQSGLNNSSMYVPYVSIFNQDEYMFNKKSYEILKYLR